MFAYDTDGSREAGRGAAEAGRRAGGRRAPWVAGAGLLAAACLLPVAGAAAARPPRGNPPHAGAGGGAARGGAGGGALTGILPVAGEVPAGAADLDGHGAPDLLDTVEEDGTVLARVRLSGARGGLEPVVVSPLAPAGPGRRDAVAGEFDAEPGRDLLLLLGGEGPEDTALWLASGFGDGTFARARPVGSTPGEGHGLALPDLDGDGRHELATAGTDGVLWVSRSAPEGFAEAEPRRAGLPGSPLGPMTVGRFARGGPPAVAVADPARSCVAVVGLLAAAPAAAPCFATRGRVSGLTPADLDGDGATELLHGRSGGGVTLLPGGRGGLGGPRTVDIGMASLSSDVLTPDLDGDGRADLVAVANARALAVARNLGASRARPIRPPDADSPALATLRRLGR